MAETIHSKNPEAEMTLVNPYKSFVLLIVLSTLILLAGISNLYAQAEGDTSVSDQVSEFYNTPDDTSPLFDHVINRKGESRITLVTGIPFVGVAEYAYGVTDRFTVGVLGGMTPAVEGYGFRMRGVVYQKTNRYRVYFCTPVIYYPRLSGGDPWWLARPNINFEWVNKNNVRYKFGGSLFLATSNNSLFGDAEKATLDPDIWSSIHAGMSLPLSGNFSFQTEVSYVSKGVKPIKDFVGAPPVVLVLGFSYTL
jgi:hypothetical protein